MPNGFKINQQAVRKMTRELQKSIDKEMAKKPVTVPTRFAPGTPIHHPAAANVTNYNGPVVTVNGDHAQIAWGNHTVNQGQSSTSEITAGYEQLAAVITNLLASLPELGLEDEDETEVRTAADTVLTEVTQDDPNPGLIKRSLTSIKGYLAQIATGTAQAATDESIAIARTAIEGLSNSLPF